MRTLDRIILILVIIVNVLLIYPAFVSADIAVPGMQDKGITYVISNIKDYPEYIFVTNSAIWGGEYATLVNSNGTFGGGGYKLDGYILVALPLKSVPGNVLAELKKGGDNPTSQVVKDYMKSVKGAIKSPDSLRKTKLVDEKIPLESIVVALKIQNISQKGLYVSNENVTYSYSGGKTEKFNLSGNGELPDPTGNPGPATMTPVPTKTVNPPKIVINESVTGKGTWKFVVIGDSPDPAINTTTGVSPALSLIAKAISAEKPDLVLYTGDLINGWSLTNKSPMQNNYTGQLGNWMKAVSPIYNYTTRTGIPLYVIRGNHEDGPPENITPLLNTYLATVASGMPTNGPSDEQKLSYSFIHKGAKFIATDDYIKHNGLKETVNQSWVNGQQLTPGTLPFTFVFGHSPAYLVDNDTEDIPFSLAIHPSERDTFWNSMVNNKVSAYLCGHAHLYVRGEKQGLQQIVSGNGGAPMQGFDPASSDPALKLEYPLKAISLSDQKVGYLVITVHEDTGTFSGVQKMYNPKTQLWETGDTFTIRAR